MLYKTFKSRLKNSKNHWFFASKKLILESIVNKKIKKSSKVLDFGSSIGLNLEIFHKVDKKNIYAYEKNKFARQKLKMKKVNIINKLGRFYNYFDIILVTDVIEHVYDDLKLIRLIKKLINKKGIVLFTVPAHQFLFSKKDETLQHYRRYSYSGLRKLLSKEFKINYLSYYNSLLFPLIAPIILINKLLGKDLSKHADSKPNLMINFILFKIFSFEHIFIKNLIKLPLGLSLISIVSKK